MAVGILGLGIIGEYIGRMMDEVRRRPLYIVSKTSGLEPRDELNERRKAA